MPWWPGKQYISILNQIEPTMLRASWRKNLEVREENFDRSSLYTFDELFFSGTAAKVSAIGSVDRRKIGTGRPGKYTKKLQKIYDELAYGNNEKYKDWLTPIY